MPSCPFCEAEVLLGTDLCDECGQDLSEMSVRVPSSSVEEDLLRDRVDQLQARPHASVAPEATVSEVLKTMAATSVGCVMIVDSRGRLAGIFSERDALLRLNAEAASHADDPIMKFMTTNPTVIDSNAKIAFALRQMDVGGYRHLPVVDAHQRPVSLISIRDVLAYLTQRVAASSSSTGA